MFCSCFRVGGLGWLICRAAAQGTRRGWVRSGPAAGGPASPCSPRPGLVAARAALGRRCGRASRDRDGLGSTATCA